MATQKRRRSQDDDESDLIEVDDDGDIYEVNRILAERKSDKDGVTYYLVLWKGYGDEEAQWECAEAFCNPDTLKEWEQPESGWRRSR